MTDKQFQKLLDKMFSESTTFYGQMFRWEDIKDKKIVDICILDTGEGEELQIVFEGGKQIEIMLCGDYIDIQTD